MTKLLEWLFGGVIFVCFWLSLLTNTYKSRVIEEWMTIVKALPAIIIGLFGVYASSVVLWRVYTFNNCDDAAKELQQQILQAKDDLTKKGFRFETSDKKSN